MATFAPALPNALAITLPNPVELPVTSATLPFNENNSSLIDGLQGTHGLWKEQVSAWNASPSCRHSPPTMWQGLTLIRHPLPGLGHRLPTTWHGLPTSWRALPSRWLRVPSHWKPLIFRDFFAFQKNIEIIKEILEFHRPASYNGTI